MDRTDMAVRSVSGTTSTGKDARRVDGSAPGVWHRSAPVAVRRAFSSGNDSAGWAAWQRHLTERRRPVDPARLLPAGRGALGWGFPEGAGPRPRPPWLDRADKLLGDRRPADPSLESDLLGWLGRPAGDGLQHPPDRKPDPRPDAGYAMEVLACCHGLPRLAAAVSPGLWWGLLEHLLAVVPDAGAIALDGDPLAHQLLAGELPLSLAYLLPEITPCRELKPTARRALASGLVDLLDGQGLPHARHLGLLRPLLACWTRCRAIGGELKGGCWNKAADNQYQWLVRQALRLARPDGTQVFSAGSAGAWSEDLFATALRLGGNQRDRDIASLVLPERNKADKRRKNDVARRDPASNSEWACVSMLRPQWSRSAERLTVAYPDQQCRIELSCGKDVLWSGPWHWELRIDGQPARPASDWEQLCWVSDEDVDFLELEIQLSGGLRVQRQTLLARQDHFLLLADAVVGARSGKLEYWSCLPLCAGICFEGAEESREGFLVGRKARALALPLALPEWRADRRVGGLRRTTGGLQLRQSAEARRLYAPLFFDLSRRRMHGRPTWRQLTVAESLAIQPKEVAVGYRVAVGGEQWLVYRSLARKANRTLLGHNLSTEMLVARFHRCGEVEPLLEIE